MRRLRVLLPIALVLATGCSAQVLAPAAPSVATEDPVAAEPEPSTPQTPAGSVRVAYPDPIGRWWMVSEEDLAAGDLAALWSLPLHRTDALGRPVPALATDAEVVAGSQPWTVEVTLAAGTWSDGEPVTARDVVATTGVLREARPAAWGAFVEAQAVDDRTVRLSFDRPFAGWSALLSAPPGVLPAHVLDEGGLAAYDDALPVTGGSFSLTGFEPGLRSSFVAHAGSPLGAPGLAELEVLVVPDHDVALGLLAAGDVDAVVGHVALDPTARRSAVPGVEGAAVFGGTRFELVWEPDEVLTAVPGLVAADLDVAPFVEGLLRDVGRLPGGALPVWDPGVPASAPPVGDGVAVGVQVVRSVDGIGLLARRLQAELEDAGVSTSLVRVDPPQHLDEPVDVDGRLRVVRVRPDRSMAALLDEAGLDVAAGLAADAEGLGSADPMGAGVAPPGAHRTVAELLTADPRVLPLAEVAVAHAWAPDRVRGLEPSGWPGLAFWSAAGWSVPTGG